MPELLPAIAILALAFFALAMAQSGSTIAKSLQNATSGIPGLGSVLGGVFGALAHALAWAAGQLETGIDAMMGAVFHALAKTLEWTFDYYKEQAIALLHVAQIVGGGLYDVSGLRSLVHRLEQAFHGIEHGVKDLLRRWHGIDRRVSKIEHELARGIGNDVRSTVQALEKWEKAAKAQLKADEKAITQTLPGEVTQLENFIKAIPGTRYLDWVAGIVTAAIGLDILNLLKCPSLLNSAKNRGCGLWNGLEDILALFFDAVLFVDLCRIVPEATKLFGEFEAPLVDLISGAANAACAQIPADWAVPTVAAGPRPPAQTLGTFPTG